MAGFLGNPCIFATHQSHFLLFVLSQTPDEVIWISLYNT